MSKDKHPSIFSPQLEALVFIILQISFATHTVLKIGKYYTLNVHVCSRGKQLVCFPESPDVSRDEVEGNIRPRGKTKLASFPRDNILSVLLYI